MSDDGRVTVGSSGMNNRDRAAVRWIGEGVAEPLGPVAPPGGTSIARIATAISGDGSVIVGTGDDPGPFQQATFIWDATHGVRDLKTVLLSYGLDVSQWSLTQVSDISADGHTIVGFGYHPQAGAQGWVAVIPEPATGAALVLVPSSMLMRRRRR